MANLRSSRVVNAMAIVACFVSQVSECWPSGVGGVGVMRKSS